MSAPVRIIPKNVNELKTFLTPSLLAGDGKLNKAIHAINAGKVEESARLIENIVYSSETDNNMQPTSRERQERLDALIPIVEQYIQQQQEQRQQHYANIAEKIREYNPVKGVNTVKGVKGGVMKVKKDHETMTDPVYFSSQVVPTKKELDDHMKLVKELKQQIEYKNRRRQERKHEEDTLKQQQNQQPPPDPSNTDIQKYIVKLATKSVVVPAQQLGATNKRQSINTFLNQAKIEMERHGGNILSASPVLLHSDYLRSPTSDSTVTIHEFNPIFQEFITNEQSRDLYSAVIMQRNTRIQNINTFFSIFDDAELIEAINKKDDTKIKILLKYFYNFYLMYFPHDNAITLEEFGQLVTDKYAKYLRGGKILNKKKRSTKSKFKSKSKSKKRSKTLKK